MNICDANSYTKTMKKKLFIKLIDNIIIKHDNKNKNTTQCNIQQFGTYFEIHSKIMYSYIKVMASNQHLFFHLK